MYGSNAHPNDRSDDPIWYFLAEFSIGEFLADHNRSDQPRAGLLFQAVQDLGISPEWIENIEMALAGLAQEALSHFKQEGLELSGRVRVFCQKKMIDNANLSRATSRLDAADQSSDYKKKVFDSDTKKKGGWGYFLIERGKEFSADSSLNRRNSIDLYLYKEGE